MKPGILNIRFAGMIRKAPRYKVKRGLPDIGNARNTPWLLIKANVPIGIGQQVIGLKPLLKSSKPG